MIFGFLVILDYFIGLGKIVIGIMLNVGFSDIHMITIDLMQNMFQYFNLYVLNTLDDNEYAVFLQEKELKVILFMTPSVF